MVATKMIVAINQATEMNNVSFRSVTFFVYFNVAPVPKLHNEAHKN